MTQLISPDDPQFFEVSSEGLYDRHNYKIVSKTGETVVVDNWETAQLTWFQKTAFLSHIEVLDKKQESKGFK
jgi:hypothetical protein